MKRNFPGTPPGRPFDNRFPGRGGPGRLPPNGRRPPPAPNHREMGRGPPPPPGRFHGRGGPGPRPPFQPGRGPPPGHMMGRGPPERGPLTNGIVGRGHPAMHGQMGRGGMPQRAGNNFGRGNMMPGGRGPPPGRHHLPMGRGPPMPPHAGTNIPPPPPRNSPLGLPPHFRHGMHGSFPHHMQGPYPNIPPPPMHPPYINQPPPMAPPPLTSLPPPPLPAQRQSLVAGPPPAHSFAHAQSHVQHSVPGGVGLTSPVTSSTAPYTAFSGAVTPAAAPLAVPAGGQSSVPTPKQIDDAWAEYTAPNGVKYYHNPLLKESTYTKPEALKKKDPLSTTPTRKWHEYEDPKTGKKYYSDGVTTTWEKPSDFESSAETSKVENSESPPKKRKKKASLTELSYSSKEEAIAAFKGLLLAKGIAPNQKWNEVAKFCSSDARWESFDQILSVGERRQALAEYQTKRANELKNEERREKIRAKEAFGQLLTDVLQTVAGFSALNPRFSDVRQSLAKDDRFHAVADEETRESLFAEFCEELRKRDERKKRNKKREAEEAFNSFLMEKEEAGTLTFASTWELFLSLLNEEDNEDSRFKVSPQLSESDRQLLFADFVIELQAAEDDKRRRIRDARRRAEKAQREAYRDVLRRLAMDGLIRPYTRWRAVEESVSADNAFNPVLAQDREAPREIFEEFVDEWDDTYRRERAFLSRLVNAFDKDVMNKPELSLDEFTKLLLRASEQESQDAFVDTKRIINRHEPLSTARLYLEELHSIAKNSSQRPGSQRRTFEEDSSEDEGEIIEEGDASADSSPLKAEGSQGKDTIVEDVDAECKNINSGPADEEKEGDDNGGESEESKADKTLCDNSEV